MVYTREQLESLHTNKLRHLLIAEGGEPQPSVPKEQLIQQLLTMAAMQPEKPKEKAVEAPKPAEAVLTTMDEIIKALNPFILRGLKVYAGTDGVSWLLRIRIKDGRVRDTNTGEIRTIEQWREDSGTLKQPLSVIRRCASVLMQGAPAAREVIRTFDPADKYTAVA